jgi:hypothetical protein
MSKKHKPELFDTSQMRESVRANLEAELLKHHQSMIDDVLWNGDPMDDNVPSYGTSPIAPDSSFMDKLTQQIYHAAGKATQDLYEERAVDIPIGTGTVRAQDVPDMTFLKEMMMREKAIQAFMEITGCTEHHARRIMDALESFDFDDDKLERAVFGALGLFEVMSNHETATQAVELAMKESHNE